MKEGATMFGCQRDDDNDEFVTGAENPHVKLGNNVHMCVRERAPNPPLDMYL